MASETVEDIVCDMRAYSSGEIADVWMHRFADSIEAAYKREMLVEIRRSQNSIGELQARLDAIVEYAKKDGWLPSGIVKEEFKNHHRLHNMSMTKIIDIANGVSK